MNPALAVVAALTIVGGVLSVTSRDVRATVLGLLVVLLGAPLVADPWPDPLSILVRIAATLLAVRLIAIGLRGEMTTGGTRIGWPADALVAAAAAVVGFGSHGLGGPGLGPAEAQATGFALVVLAVPPLVTGRDALRLSVGALLLLVGASAIRGGLDAPLGQGEQLVAAILTIAIGGAMAAISAAARAAGGLTAIDAGRPGVRSPRPPDAHRPPDRPVRTADPERPPSRRGPAVIAPRAAAPRPPAPPPADPRPPASPPAPSDRPGRPPSRAGRATLGRRALPDPGPEDPT